VNLHSLYLVVRPSVCRLCVMFIHPTRPTEIFGNVSMPFGTMTICNLSMKISQKSSQGNPYGAGLNHPSTQQQKQQHSLLVTFMVNGKWFPSNSVASARNGNGNGTPATAKRKRHDGNGRMAPELRKRNAGNQALLQRRHEILCKLAHIISRSHCRQTCVEVV